MDHACSDQNSHSLSFVTPILCMVVLYKTFLIENTVETSQEMINYENEKGFGADAGLAFAEMAKEARNVSKTVRHIYQNDDIY